MGTVMGEAGSTADKPRFAVITDSTSDISPEIAAEHDIVVVPLSVSFGADTYLDGTLSQADFFTRMKAAPELPKTSQPSVGVFVEAYGAALERADHILSIHVSNRLSGTIESARQAAEKFAGKVHVFDSLNLSWGLALQVMEAADAAAGGLDLASTVERLESARERVRLIVGLDSLENLARGGRIGRVSAFLGSMLNLKVTLTVDSDGAFQPVARSRGDRAAIEHTMAWVTEQMGDAKRAAFAVGYALGEERAHRLAEAIQERFDVSRMVVYPAGSVICTHTGSGWGVAVLPER